MVRFSLCGLNQPGGEGEICRQVSLYGLQSGLALLGPMEWLLGERYSHVAGFNWVQAHLEFIRDPATCEPNKGNFHLGICTPSLALHIYSIQLNILSVKSLVFVSPGMRSQWWFSSHAVVRATPQTVDIVMHHFPAIVFDYNFGWNTDISMWFVKLHFAWNYTLTDI